MHPGLDVEIEVDADSLEEGVIEPDESHFDRHLEVLQPAELFEQIGDLLVHLLRLAHHDAEVCRKRLDGALAADGVPTLRRDGVLDQVDERLEVGLAAATRGRAKRHGRGRARRRGVATPLKLRERRGIHARITRGAAHPVDARRRRAILHGCAIPGTESGVAVAEGPGNTQTVGREIRDRDHEVGDGIGDAVDLALHQPGTRHLEHLVLDHVIEVERFEQQLEGTLQRDRLVERNRHRRVAANRFLLEADHVEMDRHVCLLGERVENGREWLVAVRCLHLHAHPLLDLQLRGRGPRTSFCLETRAIFREILPVAGGRKLDWSDERRGGAFHVLGHIHEAVPLPPLDRLLGVEPADDAALRKQLANDRVVRGELAGFLGDRLRLGKPLGVDERVVFLHEHRQTLVDLDLLGLLTGDPGLDLGALPLHVEFPAALAGRFLDVTSGPFDPLLELASHLFGHRRVGNFCGGLVEQGKSVGGRSLRGASGLELLGSDLGRNSRHEQVIRNGGGSALGRWTGGGRAGILHRLG